MVLSEQHYSQRGIFLFALGSIHLLSEGGRVEMLKNSKECVEDPVANGLSLTNQILYIKKL